MRAKVRKNFHICKLFLHIARNQHEIAEKERRKPAFYAGLIDKERINRHGCVEMWKREKASAEAPAWETRA
jgi:hypothetical protein